MEIRDWRYELKLVCDAHWLPQARSWIRLHPAGFAATYPPRRVNSLYLDTLHLSSLNDNLAGVRVRQKLRLRWYGDAMAEVQPILELKQKRDMLGRKEQFALPCKLDLARPWADILGTLRANVAPDWRVLLQTVNQPALLNHYQREYYATPDGAVRVTLDYALAAYDQRLTPRPNVRVRLPIVDRVVIEVKAAQEHGERVQEVVAHFPLPRSRSSKYASGLRMAVGC